MECKFESSAARRIDEICDRFERSLKQRDALPVDSLLHEVAERDRPRLLQELLLLEDAYLAVAVTQHGSDDGEPTAAGLRTQVGRFSIIKTLGKGGFGTVFKAYDPDLQRIVALKVPRGNLVASEQQRARFLREARNAARLSHEGVVGVYEVGSSDGTPFIVMELIEGESLLAILRRRRLPVREAALLVAKVAGTLHFAHQQGVVHRDIKPGNILIDAAGEPRVADFGLSRCQELDNSLTREGDVLGTPSYMSPEQAAGDTAHIDGRSDIYSLGAVFYELLTGQVPFAGTVNSLLRQVQFAEPDAPRRRDPQIPRDAETICLKCLEKDSSRRYASAAELADDLNRFLRDEPIHARAVGSAERAVRLLWRRPAATTIGAMVLVVLFLLGSITWYRHHSQQLEHAMYISQARAATESAKKYEKKGEYARMTERFEHARDSLLHVIRQSPNANEARFELGTCYSHWANSLERTGQFADSLPKYREACRIRQRLVARQADKAAYVLSLGHSLLAYSSALQRGGHCFAAEQQFQQAIAALDKAQRFTDVTVDYHLSLAWRKRAAALAAAGQVEQAQQCLARANQYQRNDATVPSHLKLGIPGWRQFHHTERDD